MQTIKRVPVIDKSICTNCDRCVEACHANAIIKSGNNSCARCLRYCLTMDVPCNPGHYVFDYEQCDACGMCIESCPANAIYWVDVSK